MSKAPILVLGAGVMGLSTAVKLQDAGFDVEIWTDEDPLETTSATAAAFWEPYIVEPAEKAARWGAVSYRVFSDIAEKEGAATGVEHRQLFSIFRHPPEIPAWSTVVPTFRQLSRLELEKEFEGEMPAEFTHGFTFETWMVEMSKYLAYLVKHFSRKGTMTKRHVSAIDEAFSDHNVVINCAALGSRDIRGIDDKSVYPVAGQVLVIPRTKENTILFDTEGVTYVVARGDNTILGGTALKDLYDRTPNAETTKDILRRCMQFFPHLKNTEIRRELVGLRPARPTVRLEREQYAPGKSLIHNYGHGGAGVTLSWGCAEEVAEIVRKAHAVAV